MKWNLKTADNVMVKLEAGCTRDQCVFVYLLEFEQAVHQIKNVGVVSGWITTFFYLFFFLSLFSLTGWGEKKKSNRQTR